MKLAILYPARDYARVVYPAALIVGFEEAVLIDTSLTPDEAIAAIIRSGATHLVVLWHYNYSTDNRNGEKVAIACAKQGIESVMIGSDRENIGSFVSSANYDHTERIVKLLRSNTRIERIRDREKWLLVELDQLRSMADEEEANRLKG